MQTDTSAALLALLVAAFAGCGPSGEMPGAALSGQEEWISASGHVEPAGEVRRLVFRHPGVVGVVNTAVGSKVAAGEVLMRLRDEEETAALREAEAALEVAKAERAQLAAGVNPRRISAAEAEAELWRKNHLRQAELLGKGAGTVADLDLALATRDARNAELLALQEAVRFTDLQVMDARIHLAEARVRTAAGRLEDTLLRAPFAGAVLEVLRREGESVQGTTGDPAVVFGDLDRLRVRVEMDETHAMSLKLGLRAEVRPRDAKDRVWTGSVVLVKPVMGPKTVFAKTATERRDLDVLQALVELEVSKPVPVGLEVDVRILVEKPRLKL